MMKDLLKKVYFEFSYLLKKLKPEKPIILMYHRVADDSDDPHLLCVSPQNFRSHLKVLAEKKKVVPLRDILNPDISKNSVALTFDDGYVDNLKNLLPILKEFNAPATIFVVSGLLGQRFPWDNATSSGRAMTPQELIELSKNPLIEIGAHSITHPKLSTMDKFSQEREIAGSKEDLETIIGKKITSFAYPFGDHNEDSLEIVDKVYERTCAVKASAVNSRTDKNLLPRFIIRNWTASKFERKLNIYK